MCGIAGFIAFEKIDTEQVLHKMISKLNHRGPDSTGFWWDNFNNIGLSHARLSILDLAETGNQPMTSASGKYIMVFNGEIYNHLDIRKNLEKVTSISWRGTSDTETLLYAFEEWGIKKTIENCVGMFAIALWNKNEKTLTLIRDRVGEKPLYYGYVNSHFVFASELSAIKQIPKFNNPIDRDSVALYMSYGSIPEPYSIYENIYKLESGSVLTIHLHTKQLNVEKYWSVENQKNSTINERSIQENVDMLEQLLLDSVKLQMISDVSLGAFLSGGVDSSTIVALMQAQSTKKIDTFSIGFEQKEYNEAHYAKEIAKYLGTNHHETYVSNKEALDIIPQLSQIYSEPFSESSQIPTFLVSKIAKKNVTVCLSGDAGDELFGGYSRYKLAYNTWNKISRTPLFLRKGIYDLINAIPYHIWYTALLPLKGRKNTIGIPVNYADKLFKALPLLKIDNSKEFYHKGFMNHNLDLEKWLPNSKRHLTKFDANTLNYSDYFLEMMATDMITYLPNNNLTKVDRAAMANSLETRVPFLDYRVIEYAMALPIEYKINQGIDKWILRKVLYKYVPQKLIDRPKMGFAVPLDVWLKGPLREWGESMINKNRIEEYGFFDANFVHKKWNEMQTSKRNWQNQLWDVLIFQSWLEEKNKQ